MEEARKNFGSMLLNWRRQNRWTQYTAYNWAKEAGFETISYGNLSVIEQGKAGELRQRVFIQLEELNERITHKNFGALKNPDIKAKVKAAQPLGDDECQSWGAVEFWSCYIGRREVPKTYKSLDIPPPLTDRKAKELNNTWRRKIKRLIENGKIRLEDVPVYWQHMLLDIADLDFSLINLMWYPQKQKYTIDLWIEKIEAKQ